MKNILVFEADQVLAEDLKGQFAQYGCNVDIVDDGNVGLQKARSTRPDLILLTIELPKMNGFSICNKLKKNPELKSIPLIILSSEATEDTFAQHRKLRTHAEDYLRKPFDFSQLIGKVSALIELGTASTPSQLPVPDDDEISVDTSGLDLVVEQETAANGPLGDDDVEAFAESAFAALQMDDEFEEEESSQPPAPFDVDDETIAIDREFQEPSEQVSENVAATGEPPEVSESDSQYPPTPDSYQPSSAADQAVEAPEAVFDEEVETPRPTTPAPIAIDEGDHEATEDLSTVQAQLQGAKETLEQLESERERARELNRELEALRSENEELKKAGSENEELKKAKEEWSDKEKRLHRDKEELNDRISLLNEQLKALEKEGGKGGGAVSSREFLDLRELLNKKDREILDFKDQINAKEKALLEQRERITSLEREIADAGDKALAIEREREELRDKAKGLEDDKTLLKKKVEGLEKRLDASSKDIERLKKEIEGEKDRRKAELEAAEEQKQKDLAELKTQLEAEGEVAKEAALTTLREELTATHEVEIEQTKKDAEERRESDLTTARLKHEEKLKAATEELEATHSQAISELEAKQVQEIQEAARRHKEEQDKLGEQKNQEMEELRQEHAKTLGELLQSHREEIRSRDQKLANLDTDLEKTQRELAERSDKVSELEKELSQKTDRLSKLEQKKSQLESDLAQTSSRLDAALQWNEHNRSRAESALEKIRGDGEALEKSKRAMAIALTLLSDLAPHDDPGPPPGDEQSAQPQ